MIHHDMSDAVILRCFDGVEGLHLRVIRDRLRYRHAQLEEARTMIREPLPHSDLTAHQSMLYGLMRTLDRDPY